MRSRTREDRMCEAFQAESCRTMFGLLFPVAVFVEPNAAAACTDSRHIRQSLRRKAMPTDPISAKPHPDKL